MMARMRTLDAAIAQLKEEDPGSCLTRNALRNMVLTGKVPYVRAGTKYLVNYDMLLSVLGEGERFKASTASEPNGIRPIILSGRR